MSRTIHTLTERDAPNNARLSSRAAARHDSRPAASREDRGMIMPRLPAAANRAAGEAAARLVRTHR